jgi:hypothetical protein
VIPVTFVHIQTEQTRLVTAQLWATCLFLILHALPAAAGQDTPFTAENGNRPIVHTDKCVC